MEIAATTALVLLALLSVFQLALVFGAPLGRFAWGGQHEVLPQKLRVSSLVAIGIYVVFAVFIASKADMVSILPNNSVILTVGVWVIIAYLAVGTVANALSRSKQERYTMAPVSLVLLVCFLVAATQ